MPKKCRERVHAFFYEWGSFHHPAHEAPSTGRALSALSWFPLRDRSWSPQSRTTSNGAWQSTMTPCKSLAGCIKGSRPVTPCNCNPGPSARQDHYSSVVRAMAHPSSCASDFAVCCARPIFYLPPAGYLSCCLLGERRACRNCFGILFLAGGMLKAQHCKSERCWACTGYVSAGWHCPKREHGPNTYMSFSPEFLTQAAQERLAPHVSATVEAQQTGPAMSALSRCGLADVVTSCFRAREALRHLTWTLSQEDAPMASP